ncbi:hypothetical protein DEH84_00280 [Aquabacterium olei]|jgi:hypothetical protein|uniref:Uncharacterized protein n=1 Tax=Aquabacterium olei TaxID=1296669 RepID=A0A2U8FMB7_9BURK|nr:hypothetical protein [Aquabacterium olei]AWI52057.1 hypothetical protein DEH84_00280 [Aquabacterium olei]
MSIVVYWLSAQGPGVQGFADGELSEALAFAEAQRKARSAEGQPLHSHVVISTELGDHVGLAGVSDERPADYSWTKSHRGGPPDKGNPPKTLA